jgi:hypothetical protein
MTSISPNGFFLSSLVRDLRSTLKTVENSYKSTGDRIDRDSIKMAKIKMEDTLSKIDRYLSRTID